MSAIRLFVMGFMLQFKQLSASPFQLMTAFIWPLRWFEVESRRLATLDRL